MTRFSITAATLLAAGLLLVAADADAHGARHGVHDGYRGPAHVVHRRHPAVPRWLRKHRDFLHWHAAFGYRYGPGVSWHYLYRSYRDDYRWHRYRYRHHAGGRHYRCGHRH